MYKKREKIIKAIVGFIFLAGLSVMLYPYFANWWNRNMASHTIAGYKEKVAQIETGDSERILAEAREYNENLAGLYAPFSDFEQVPGYEEALNISGTGVMGYLSVPSIRVELPIYHGTSDGVLQMASGHIQGSSLSVGGVSTHAVISGHRGLPNAKLFTDLDQIVEGDTFTVHILNEVLTYEVDRIQIILPTDTAALAVVPGEDLVTLMTCTPYGINSHRLLIRGHRIETASDRRVRVNGDAIQVDSLVVMTAVFVPLLVMLLLWWWWIGKRRKRIRIDRYTIAQLPSGRGEENGRKK
jgi:sortase A